MLRSDSIFTEFQKKAALRFQKGESNLLEKTSAENQKGVIKIQAIQVLQEIQSNQLYFQLILNQEEKTVPELKKQKLELKFKTDFELLKNHPFLEFFEQQRRVTESKTKLEKSKLLPSFTIGYNNTTFLGTGADNAFYDKSNQIGRASCRERVLNLV